MAGDLNNLVIWQQPENENKKSFQRLKQSHPATCTGEAKLRKLWRTTEELNQYTNSSNCKLLCFVATLVGHATFFPSGGFLKLQLWNGQGWVLGWRFSTSTWALLSQTEPHWFAFPLPVLLHWVEPRWRWTWPKARPNCKLITNGENTACPLILFHNKSF